MVETIFQFKRSPGNLPPTTLRFGEPAWVEETNTLYIGKADETVVGIPFGTSYQPLSSRLNELAALSPANGAFLVGNGSSFLLQSGAGARSLLGLGSAAIASATDFVGAAEKGVAGGIATLDGTGKVPATQLPAFNVPVQSVFGRIGTVIAQSGDYTAAQVGALATANNLNDLANVATARANLGLGTAAIANATTLLDRTNHTGTQAIGTIAGLEASLNSKLSGQELANHQSAPVLDHPDGSVTDIKIGNRTASDTTAPTNLGPGSLTQWFGWLANRIKSITGKTNWWETPATTLEATASHLADTSNPHNVTADQIGAIPVAQKGVANGVATLDGAGKVPTAQIPPIAINDTFPVNSESEMLALTAEVGDFAVRLDNLRTFVLRLPGPSTLSNWQQILTPASGVTSVFGRTGVVGAQSGDYTAAQVGALAIANDLSDLSSPSIARTNLGLGSLATKSSLLAADIPNLDAGKITTGVFADSQIPGSIARDSEVQNAVSSKIDSSEKGAPGGVASLDAGGKVPTAQLPELGAVQSVFGRVGTVEAATGDYDTDQVVEGASNLYFTVGRSRASVSATGPLAYNASTGTFSIPAASSAQDGYLSSGDKSKLDGIAANATANQGTVTSVALSVPSDLTVAGSPITTSGTLAVTRTSQAANQVMAAPDGAAGVPTYRALVANDIPAIPSSKISDSTAVGRSLIAAVDAAAARTVVGAVAGPASSTNAAIALFNGTSGGLLQNSPLTMNSTTIFSTNGQLGLSMSGDSLGGCALFLRNRNGSNGAVFQNLNLDLVDFGFLTSTSAQGNLRYEHRSGAVLTGNSAGEFQFFNYAPVNGAAFLRIGEGQAAFSGNVAIAGTLSAGGLTSLNGNLVVNGTASDAYKLRVSSLFTSYPNTNLNIGGAYIFDCIRQPDNFVILRIDAGGNASFGTNLAAGGSLTAGNASLSKVTFPNNWGVDKIVFRSDILQKIAMDSSGNFTWTTGVRDFYFADTVKFGIGTGTPGCKLQVAGGLAVSSTTTATTDPGAGNAAIAGTLKLGSYTVATLPAPGTAGRKVYATDAKWSGGIGCEVLDNGSIWLTPDGVQASTSGYHRIINTSRALDRTDRIIWANTAGIVITLPLVSAYKHVPYRSRNISAGDITITVSGTDTIEGVTSISLAAGNSYDFENDGSSSWRVM